MKAASILLALVLVLAGIAYYFTGVDHIQNHMKLGLDLKGGINMVYQGVDSDLGKATPDAMQKAMKVIENRVNKLGVSEPLVQLDSNNRIIVQLAGETDPQKAEELVGKTAVLAFVGPDGQTILDGKDVAKAGVSTGGTSGSYVVTLQLKGEGPQKFADATKKFINQQIAIKLDDQVISSPVVNAEITGGNAEITGNFTAESATQLADLINGGALPVKLELKENRVVTATLGSDSLAKSAKAGVIGLGVVLFFMLVIYRIPGLMANIALVIYTMLTLAFLMGINATFTLPGLAGILLSIGMAVDGNIIIFERIKEELRNGKGLRSGIDAGFHRALNAFVDGQVTTLIAGVVLWYLGTGPVKGFALTLSVGTVLSMFTAITVSRWLLNGVVATGWFDKRLFGIKEVQQ